MVRVMINNRVEFVLFPGTLALSPHVFAKFAARHRALFVLYTQSIGEREVTFPSSDLDAVLTVLVTVALAHAIHGDPRCEFRGTPARFSRLCPSHVLRLRGGRMVSVDSVLQGFLVARVVLGSLSALAFRVIVERQFLHHATATHIRGVEGKLDSMRVLGNAGEGFRSAAPGVVRAPVQDGAVRDVGGRRARVHVANWNHPWPWPLAAPLPRHLDRVLKSLSDFRRLPVLIILLHVAPGFFDALSSAQSLPLVNAVRRHRGIVVPRLVPVVLRSCPTTITLVRSRVPIIVILSNHRPGRGGGGGGAGRCGGRRAAAHHFRQGGRG